MESVQLCSKPFRRGVQRVVSDMGITLCRRWIGVAEKDLDLCSRNDLLASCAEL